MESFFAFYVIFFIFANFRFQKKRKIMKKFILSTLLFLCFLIVKAQYSTDKFAVNFAIRNMPKYYVPEQNRNFSVVFNAPRQVKRCFETSEELETFFSPMGWSLNRENPYLEIFIAADYLVIDRIYEIEEVEEIKDKGEVLQRKFYRPAMDYHIPIAITASSPQGAITIENVTDKIPHEPIIYTFVVSERFRSPRHAHDFFLDNKEIFVESEIRNRIFECYDLAIPAINRDYVYTKGTEVIHTWLLDSKKSEFYSKYKLSKEEIRNIFLRVNEIGGLEVAIRDLKPYIELLIKESEAMNVSDKKQKAAKADIYCGLSDIYYGLEIFDVSKEYAKKVLELGDSRGSKLLKKIDSYNADLQKHHINSKHFEL